MKFDPVETGKRIRKLRETKKWNQYDLAEELSVSHSHISKIEKGLRIGGMDIYVSIALLFGVSLDYLIMGNANEVAKAKIRIAMEILEGVERGL